MGGPGRAQAVDRRRDAAAGGRQAAGLPDRDDREAIRRLIDRLGGPDGLALCYEAGSGGVALWRLLRTMGVACDIVAPLAVAVRAGDRVKTDRRDATKPVALHRSGLLSYVQAPTPEIEGLRDLAGRPARPLRRTPPVLCDPDSRP